MIRPETFRGMDIPRVEHLASVLVKLLQHAPNTALEGIEDSRTAEWCASVDRVGQSLLAALGGYNMVSTLARALLPLMEREAAARELLPTCAPDQNVWLYLLDWATLAKGAYAHDERERSTLKAENKRLQLLHIQHANELGELQRVVRELQELQYAPTAVTPGRRDAATGIMIVDVGD